VARYQVRAVRTAYLITRDPQLAQDVVQDVFLQVYRGIGSFDAQRPFEPWFIRSVVHASWKAAARASRRQSITSPGSELEADESWLQEWVDRQPSVEAQVEGSEYAREIWQTLEALSPRQRAVIVQRYFLEMSEKDMALELGAAPGTVKWLLNAARERLRKLLGSERSAK